MEKDKKMNEDTMTPEKLEEYLDSLAAESYEHSQRLNALEDKSKPLA